MRVPPDESVNGRGLGRRVARGVATRERTRRASMRPAGRRESLHGASTMQWTHRKRTGVSGRARRTQIREDEPYGHPRGYALDDSQGRRVGSAVRALDPAAGRVARQHVDDAALAEADDLAAGRDLNAIDQLALPIDHVVDRAGDRAGARGRRANPEVAVGVAARRARPNAGR